MPSPWESVRAYVAQASVSLAVLVSDDHPPFASCTLNESISLAGESVESNLAPVPPPPTTHPDTRAAGATILGSLERGDANGCNSWHPTVPTLRSSLMVKELEAG